MVKVFLTAVLETRASADETPISAPSEDAVDPRITCSCECVDDPAWLVQIGVILQPDGGVIGEKGDGEGAVVSLQSSFLRRSTCVCDRRWFYSTRVSTTG